MNCLVDAHLPLGICKLLQAAGHQAIHTCQLPTGNRTSDRVINKISSTEQRVVVSKDTDIYYSHLLKQLPWKLLLVRTGNLRAIELVALFERQLPTIIAALSSNTLVEIDRATVQVVQ